MSSTNILVALDDGHGEDTPGKRTPKFSDGTFMQENDFNRVVVDLLAKELKRCGFNVMFTAPEEKDVTLKTRSTRANTSDANILISIHANAYDGSFEGANPSGFEIHIYGKGGEAENLAKCCIKELKKGTPLKNRGIKVSNFHMLRETKMPAILAELGFMDNISDARLLLSDEYREECAIEIAKGVCKYYRVPYAPENKREVANEDKLFKVQVGAFTYKDNAEKLLKMLEKEGFRGFIKVE